MTGCVRGPGDGEADGAETDHADQRLPGGDALAQLMQRGLEGVELRTHAEKCTTEKAKPSPLLLRP
jgi:hypothetical protein